jgi:hypothetical protein
MRHFVTVLLEEQHARAVPNREPRSAAVAAAAAPRRDRRSRSQLPSVSAS